MQEQENALSPDSSQTDAKPAVPPAVEAPSEVPPQRKWQTGTLPQQNQTPPPTTVTPNVLQGTALQQPVPYPQQNNVPPQRPVGYPPYHAVSPMPQRPAYVPPYPAVPPQVYQPMSGYSQPQAPPASPYGNVPPQMQNNGNIPPQMQQPNPNPVPPQGNGTPQAQTWNTNGQMNWYQQNRTPHYAGGFQVPPQIPPREPAVPMTPEKKDKRTAFWLKIVAGLLVVILLYCIGSDVVNYRRGGVVTSNTTASQTVENGNGTGADVVIEQQEKPSLDPTQDGVSEDGSYTVEGVASAVRPSIVEIYTYGDADATQISGSGSGIILSEDGYIITNAHVLTDGKSFTVTASDKTEYTAQVVGRDAKTDLAVIKVDASGLPAATMGNSDEVVLGESVVAIGNPAGLTGSVTNGIVSGLNRQIRSDVTGFDMNCIQTNAAISPGNSGGALVNMYGQVIGITSSKYVSSSYEGLGFAITINEVLPIVQDLIQNGHVSDRVRIGITLVSLNSTYVQTGFAEEIGMTELPTDLKGIWINGIDAECDIANTELEVNDVIVAVNGMEVSSYDDLNKAIEGLKADDAVQADCRRYTADGTYTEFSISFQLMADTSGDY